jgi:hypothetical protein
MFLLLCFDFWQFRSSVFLRFHQNCWMIHSKLDTWKFENFAKLFNPQSGFLFLQHPPLNLNFKTHLLLLTLILDITNCLGHSISHLFLSPESSKCFYYALFFQIGCYDIACWMLYDASWDDLLIKLFKMTLWKHPEASNSLREMRGLQRYKEIYSTECHFKECFYKDFFSNNLSTFWITFLHQNKIFLFQNFKNPLCFVMKKDFPFPKC